MQVGLPIFQSTCPMRGTTHIQAGEAAAVRISIHVPRAGHDERRIIVLCLIEIFQSTCPVRGTTKSASAWQFDGEISIHVPRAGHDTIILRILL